LTDQEGLFGSGEATLECHTRAVAGAVQDLAELGERDDPARVEHFWQMMVRQHFWHGSAFFLGPAITRIDLAPSVILGTPPHLPCARLSSGRGPDDVRVARQLGGGRMEDFYETAADAGKRFGELARDAVAGGLPAFKSMAGPPTMRIEGLKLLRAAEQAVAAM